MGNVPKFRSEKAARAGCTENSAVIVLPLTVPEENCNPLICWRFLHISDFLIFDKKKSTILGKGHSNLFELSSES